MDLFFDKLSNLLLFFVLYTFVFLSFFGTINYTLPFVLALICALILKTPTEALINKFKFKSSLASLITTFVFFSVLILLLTFGIAIIGQEAVQLAKSTQAYFSKNSNDIYSTFNELKKYYDNLDPTIITTIENNFSSGVTKASNLAVAATSKIVSILISFLTSIPYLIMVILFTLLATYFFTKDISSVNKEDLLNIMPSNKPEKLLYIIDETKKMFGKYLFSYFIIIFLTFIETIIVFLIFKVKYALLLSIICAIADLLPILGIAAVYIPLALIYLFISKNYITALGLIISYVVVSIVRQIVEPKIVSSTLGIHPVAVLAALFIGLKAAGFTGMIYCIFLVVFYTIFKKVKLL